MDSKSSFKRERSLACESPCRSPLTAASSRLGLGLALSWLVAITGACSVQSDTPERPPAPNGGQAGAGLVGTSVNANTSTAAGSAGNPTPGAALGGTAGAPNDNPVGNGVIPLGSGSNTPVAGPMETCASGFATTSPVTPTVWLIVDGSSSMNQPFDPAGSRWQVLRSTLMDPGGVVDSLQALVKFGMVLYSGGAADPTQCVNLVTVEPALDNLANLAAQYPAAPLSTGTPTDRALDYVVSNLPIVSQAMLDTRTDPIYVVLATDGQPNDMCGGLRGGGMIGSPDVEQRVVDITTRGTQAGMHMYVISMAGNDARLQAHLEQVAQATESKTPPYAPSTQQDLVDALRKITGSASCQVGLDGMVESGQECKGTVTLNGIELTCNDANGWRLFDARTVQLTGNACTDFTDQTGLVQARFPCDVFMPD